MKIVVEDWNTACPFSINESRQFTIKIGEKEYHFQMGDYWWEAEPTSGWQVPRTHYKFTAEQINKLTVKSKEQIAAEESVAKAKEALKAAENALRVVKEQKK